jgi:hypothetical protein
LPGLGSAHKTTARAAMLAWLCLESTSELIVRRLIPAAALLGNHVAGRYPGVLPLALTDDLSMPDHLYIPS